MFVEDITSKWREEILQSGEDVTLKMVDWIIKELQWKASIFQEEDLVTVFDVGVIKSDTVISAELKQALKLAVAPFDNVPEEEKDYHPGSDRKVVDLVHPSICPVIYGRTRILQDRVIGLDGCLASAGQGELLPVPPDEEAKLEEYDLHFSNRKKSALRNCALSAESFNGFPVTWTSRMMMPGVGLFHTSIMPTQSSIGPCMKLSRELSQEPFLSGTRS